MRKTLWNSGWTVAAGIPDPFGELFGNNRNAEAVLLPQDAMVLEQRDPNCVSATQTGFYPVKSYTYEKRFFAPEDWKEQETVLEFEGVMSRAMVYLNGEFLAGSHYGYIPFLAPLNAHLRYGEENTLRVLALGQERGSRWYPGAGIYRDVWLHQASHIHVVPGGVRLTTEEICGYAVVAADISLGNTGLSSRKVQVCCALLNPDGSTAARKVHTVSLLQTETVSTHMRLFVDKPRLWSADDPQLYRYEVTICDGETELDRAEGTFGIRTVRLDARHGLRINGVETKLRGACIHHDNGILGATILPDAEEFKLRKLKKAGFNAIRIAHHPAAPATLDACDRLGILVMDELSDMWDQPKNPADFAVSFSRDWREAMEGMVRKDYGHPCIILYSLGNEIPEIGRRSGGRRTRELANALRGMDPTRFVTCAFNGFLAASDQITAVVEKLQEDALMPNAGGSEALNAAMSKMDRNMMDAFSTNPILEDALEEASCALDVTGYNYLTALHTHIHKAHPERVVVGSETYPVEIPRLWPIVEQNSHVIGDFTWTGCDYLGEAGLACYHYAPERHEQGWYPDRLAYCGDINLNGYRRPVSFLREIAFGLRKAPFLAVERLNRLGQTDNTNDWKYADALDSWTWPGFEGKTGIVHVLSGSGEVELFLNGKSLGRKQPGAELDVSYTVEYEPGELLAVGYTGGREDGRCAIKTAGSPARLLVDASANRLTADGRSVAFLTIDLLDADGNPNRWEEKNIHVEVEGAGILAGFGSADPQAEGSYQAGSWKTFDGRVLAAIRSTQEAGDIRVKITAENMEPVIIRMVSHASV